MIDANFIVPVTVAKRSNARALCTCKHCGIVFKPKSTDRVTFCSRECAYKHKKENGIPPFTPVYAGHCKGCGASFVSRNTRQRHCCAGCVPRIRPEYVSTAPETKICRHCGKEYKPKGATRPEVYCSYECKDNVSHALKRTQRLKRKALIKGITVEAVDPFKVFDRDRWRCQLCGVKTPKSKRGTYNDNAPELDHILPLSKGGDHSYLNTQCACRKCNGAKSSTPMGQMLMFG